MPRTDSFDEVVHRLREGDERAAAEVFHRFAGRLIGLARSRLDSQIRRTERTVHRVLGRVRDGLNRLAEE